MNRTAFAFVIATMCAAPLFAADPGESASRDLEVTVTNVRGIVQVRRNEDASWEKAKPGMSLGVGAEFRTGPRSGVQLAIEPDQTITLDRLGRIKVLTAIKEATGEVKTDLGMAYGRTRYHVEAAGTAHASTIHTPNSSLGVRGTEVGVQQDFENIAWSTEHCAFYTPAGADEMQFCAPGVVNGGFTNPGDSRKDDDRVDPRDDDARDDEDDKQLNDNPGGWFDFQFGGFGGNRERGGSGDFRLQHGDDFGGGGDFGGDYGGDGDIILPPGEGT
jgi:hypothetical protein